MYIFSPRLEVCEQYRHPVSGERCLLPAQRREVVLLVGLALLVVLAVSDEEDVPRRLRRELGHLWSDQQSSLSSHFPFQCFDFPHFISIRI